MAKSLFSVPIFFIAFRECLEASLIIAILLGLVEQIVHQQVTDTNETVAIPPNVVDDEKDSSSASGSGPSSTLAPTTRVQNNTEPEAEDPLNQKLLIRRMRIHIFLGAAIGVFIALAIGAAFIAVWFTQASNIWSKSEALWEGIFSLIASAIIMVMGLTMLKLDQAKAKWRVKLRHAFAKNSAVRDASAKTGRYALLILPMVTVLREGLEAVVFIGGVALGQPASSIPIAAIVGIVCGLVVGVFIYLFASKSSLRVFLIVMTSLLLLIGAGLFSKGVWFLEANAFTHLLGVDVDDAVGDGPGTFRVSTSVWHLDCCNPEDTTDSQGWSIFNAIFGWTNSATFGSVLSYIAYWITVIISLVYMKWKEGRIRIFGWESRLYKERMERARKREMERSERESLKENIEEISG